MELLKKKPCGAYRCNAVVTVDGLGGDPLPCNYENTNWRIIRVEQTMEIPLCAFLLINGKIADIVIRADARSAADRLTVRLCGSAKLPERCEELKVIARPYTTTEGKSACLLELNGGCFVCNAFRNGQLWIEVSVPLYYRFDTLIANGHSLYIKSRVFTEHKFEFKGTGQIDAFVHSPSTILRTEEGDISLEVSSATDAYIEVRTNAGNVEVVAKGFEKTNVLMSSMSSEDLYEPGLKPGRRGVCLNGKIMANYGTAVIK